MFNLVRRVKSAVLYYVYLHITERFGCNFRDLRLLDPATNSAAAAFAIFTRSRCLIVNLEALRVIIEKDKTTVVSSPRVGAPLNDMSAPEVNSPLVIMLQQYANAGEHSPLPYETRALEAALLIAVSTWEKEVSALQRQTTEALEKLTKVDNQLDLTAARHCKSDIAKLTERLRKGLRAIESLLDEKDDFSLPPVQIEEKAKTDEPPASIANYPTWAPRYGLS